MEAKSFFRKYGDWALITGASSGIGAEFAKQLADLNFNLVLIARREENLKKLSAALISKNKIETVILSLDLSKPDFIKQIEQQTQHLDIGLLINNAGFAITGSFLEDALENQLSLLEVNCKAPLILSHYFGNKMVKKGKGGIINIASASAFLPIPYWTNYSSSKAYLLHFTEGLWYELKEKGVDVLAVCPGATQTEFSATANVKGEGMKVQSVVTQALNSIGKTPTIITGIKNQLTTAILKLFTRRLLIKIGAKVIERIGLHKIKNH